MSQLNGMNGHDASSAQVALPILIGVFVIDSVLDIIWEKILEFNGCAKFEVDLRVLPVGLDISG